MNPELPLPQTHFSCGLDLRSFASYSSYYAGLAGIVAALYFIHLAALVRISGGEFNRALRIRRLARLMSDERGQGEESTLQTGAGDPPGRGDD